MSISNQRLWNGCADRTLDRSFEVCSNSNVQKKGLLGVHVGADGVELFTRKQAAKYLRLSLRTVRGYANAGRIESLKIHGIELFTRAALERFRASSQQGQLAAKAFRLLEQGISPAAVVIELQITPELAREYAQMYSELSGAWLVAGPTGNRETWQRTFKIGELTPAKLRRALELVAITPALQTTLLEQQQKAS